MKVEQVLLNVPFDGDYECELIEYSSTLEKYINDGFIIKQISTAGATVKTTYFCCVVLLERKVEEE